MSQVSRLHAPSTSPSLPAYRGLAAIMTKPRIQPPACNPASQPPSHPSAHPFARTQDWAPLVNEQAQGMVDIQYRTGPEPGRPPDLQTIQKQMAIVAWQPGPNRILQVPTEVRASEHGCARVHMHANHRTAARASTWALVNVLNAA
eukprot:353919-Chlamydomonas_euryale.AAC.10